MADMKGPEPQQLAEMGQERPPLDPLVTPNTLL